MSTRLRVVGSIGAALLMATVFAFRASATQRLVLWGNTPGDPPGGLGELRAITAGSGHCVVAGVNGTVATWGANWNGELNVPLNLGPVVAVSAGDSHTLALRPNGTVAAWGWNDTLQCQVPAGLWDVAAISAGGMASMALKRDGTVVAWGYEGNGQTNVPPDLRNVVAISLGGTHALALKANGSVTAWGDNSAGQTMVPAQLTNAVAISAGPWYNVALTADGHVMAWGQNNTGQTNVPAGLDQVVAVAASEAYSLALKADGTVVAWGSGSSGQTNIPPGLSNVVAIAASPTYAMALSGGTLPYVTSPLADRTVAQGFPVYFRATAVGSWPLAFQWKLDGIEIAGATNAVLSVGRAALADQGWYSVVVSNAFGGVESDPALLEVLPLFMQSQPLSQMGYRGNSVSFTVGVDSAWPATFQWEFNGVALLGETNQTLVLTDLQPTDAGLYAVMVRNAVGSVRSADAELTISQIAAWGFNPFCAMTNVPPNLPTVVGIASGFEHSLVVLADGTVREWGNTVDWPTQVPVDLHDAVAAAAGGSHSLALRADGTVVGWGVNSSGQVNVPAGLTNAVAIAAGNRHSLALKADGTVVAWGDNSARQTDVPRSLTNVVGIAAGTWNSVALRADGSVATWGGSGTSYLTNTPSGVTNAVAIGAGPYHGFALTAEGRVVAWNSAGAQVSVPAGLTNVVAVAASYTHCLALQADGNVVVWGDNWALANPPPRLSGIVALAAGEYTSMALVGVGPPVLKSAVTQALGVYGRSVYLHAEVSGSPPVAYQWRFNGAEIPGATSATLELHNLQFEQAGAYSLVVSNAYGTATNAPVYLTVLPFMITAQPQSQTVLPTAAARFEIGVLGQPPFAYRWQFNGTDLPDATNSFLVITNSQLSDAGLYSVNVSNAVGSVRSAEALLSLSSVVVWGTNNYGQMDVPEGLMDVVALASGQNHLAALRRDGTVVAWGDNRYGQTNVPMGLTDVVAIASGPGNHTLALKSDGTVVAWGANNYHQTNVPSVAHDIVAIAAGESHSLAVRADGAVLAWGRNQMGQTNVPDGLTTVVGLAGLSTSSAALRANGTVAVWGTNIVVFPPSGSKVPLTNLVSIAGGSSHIIGLRANGTVVSTDGGRLGDPTPTGLSNVVAVSAGVGHSLALKRDGTVVTWTAPLRLQTPSGLTNMGMVAGGLNHSAAAIAAGAPFLTAGLPDRALLAGSTNYFWVSATGARPLSYQWQCNGTNILGATQAVFTVSNAQTNLAGVYSVLVSNAFGVASSREFAVSLVPLWITTQPANVITFQGGNAAFTVTASGATPFRYQWQLTGVDVPGATRSYVSLANVQLSQAGDYVVKVSNTYGEALSRAANLAVNRVAAWGAMTNVPAGLSNAVAISVGGVSCAALKADSTVKAWGQSGSIGIPAGLSNVVALASGLYHTLALKSDGTVAGWGSDYVAPAGLSNVVALTASDSFSVAVLADGTVRAWGINSAGQINVPHGLANVVSVASDRAAHVLALRDDGTVAAWGYNDHGQTVVPPGLTKVVSVRARFSLSVALKDDGTVVPWGDNSCGQTAVPQGLTGVVKIETTGYEVLALKADGTVVAWGYNYSGGTNALPGLTNVVDIVPRSLALKQDGTIVTWGETLPGQAIVPMLRNVQAVEGACVALLGDGPPDLSRPVADLSWRPAEFGFSFPTERGRVYLVEFKDALTDQTWAAFPLIRGNGRVQHWSDTSASGTNRFYRVRCW